jgi:hypothetical protein
MGYHKKNESTNHREPVRASNLLCRHLNNTINNINNDKAIQELESTNKLEVVISPKSTSMPLLTYQHPKTN